jgi:phage terminase large subunit-like protein
VRLEMFQKLFLTMLFELRPDGSRRYRRAYLETLKGCGKTSLAAMIGAYQLAHQFSAEIPVCAASYDQTEMVFGDLRTMVAESPTLSQVMIPLRAKFKSRTARRRHSGYPR